MKRSNLIITALGFASASLLLAGCSTTPASTAGAASTAWTIGYPAPVEAQFSQQAIVNALASGAKNVGWKSDIIDANLSPDKQTTNMQTMVQKHDNALAVWPIDSGAMQGTIAQAKAAGIAMIGINNDSPEYTSKISWQIYQCGADAPAKQTALMIAKLHPGGKVLVMGGPPVVALQDYAACFTTAAKAAGLTVENQTDNPSDDSGTASTLAADMLSKYPGVNAFWSYNDTSALGISAAVIQAGGTISTGGSSGTIVVGSNGDAAAVQAVRQGRLTGTWDPDSAATGVAIVKAAKDIQAGKPDKDLVIKSKFVTKATIGSYVAPAKRNYTINNLPLATN